jgi:hypothetical protein
MSVGSELEMFLLLHREHGRLTPVWGRPTLNGHRLEVACSCGVMFGRWVTRDDVFFDRTVERVRSAR